MMLLADLDELSHRMIISMFQGIKFNKDMFNHEFQKYKQAVIVAKTGSQIVRYDIFVRDFTRISMIRQDSIVLLGQAR